MVNVVGHSYTPARHTGSGRIIDLKTVRNHLGALSVAEIGRELPFTVRRVYILHELDGMAVRGVHAHMKLRQLMIAMHGATTVTIDNGRLRKDFVLDHPDKGLLVEPVAWRELAFSKGAVLAVLASDPYDVDDYIGDYGKFLAYLKNHFA